MRLVTHIRRVAAPVFPAVVAAVALCLAGNAAAHDGVTHASATAPRSSVPVRPADTARPPVGQAAPLRFDMGGPFALTDHNRVPRTDRDFRGRHMLVFFGYATCDGICPVGLKRMVDALDALGLDAATIQPVFITVDPERDTPAKLKAYLPKLHPRLIGLTGSTAALRAVAKAYNVPSKVLAVAPDGSPTIRHGAYIYLMRPNGKFATLFPPVMGSDAIAATVRRYVSAKRAAAPNRK
jgi:protein SCO1/2